MFCETSKPKIFNFVKKTQRKSDIYAWLSLKAATVSGGKEQFGSRAT
jgi:hypothetical protein